MCFAVIYCHSHCIESSGAIRILIYIYTTADTQHSTAHHTVQHITQYSTPHHSTPHSTAQTPTHLLQQLLATIMAMLQIALVKVSVQHAHHCPMSRREAEVHDDAEDVLVQTPQPATRPGDRNRGG